MKPITREKLKKVKAYMYKSVTYKRNQQKSQQPANLNELKQLRPQPKINYELQDQTKILSECLNAFVSSSECLRNSIILFTDGEW